MKMMIQFDKLARKSDKLAKDKKDLRYEDAMTLGGLELFLQSLADEQKKK